MNDRRTVAAFDFDGTLTYRDTLLSFIIFTFGFWETLRSIIPQLPSLALYTIGLVSRQQAKERVLTRFFAGKSEDQIREYGKKFALEAINQKIRPEALERLKWHLEKGDWCILISASIDIYLEPWAKGMGFQETICSKMEFNSQGQATGKLEGLNCWGPEKERRLVELLGPRESYILYAYGDSRGDKELLDHADFPFYRKFK